MKRTPLKRRTPIARGKPLNKINEAQQARRKKRTAKLRQTPEHRQARAEAFERAEGQCEYVVNPRTNPIRCTERDSLEAHHVKYQPPVLVIYCRRHHELVESELRPWNRGRFA